MLMLRLLELYSASRTYVLYSSNDIVPTVVQFEARGGASSLRRYIWGSKEPDATVVQWCW